MWLRDWITNIRIGLASGTIHTCPHLDGEQVVIVPLWQPDRASCGICSWSFLLTGAEDRRCDRCHTIGDSIHPDVFAVDDRLLIACGLCPTCHRKEVAPR